MSHCVDIIHKWMAFALDQYIAVNCLSCIALDDIKELIPVVGLRTKFLKAYKTLVSNENL